MVNAITRKLHRFEMLRADDAVALDRLAHGAKSYFPHKDIITIGDKPNFALAILSGWAFRYIVRRDGSRQITGFLLPGDFCHLNMLSEAPMDDSIVALSPVLAAYIRSEDIAHLLAAHPNIAKAVQASQFADESRLRGTIANLGRQNAAQRLGYMLCEIWSRADAVGLVEGDRLDFPLTQTDVADAIGLTAVHVNRMMQRLRGDGLLDLKERCLALPEFGRLAHMSGYRTTATGNDRHYQAPKLHGYTLAFQRPNADSHHLFLPSPS